MSYLFLMMTIIGLDQWSKYKAQDFLRQRGSFYSITKRFQLRLAHNPGGFYGLLENKKRLLYIITFFAIVGCAFLLYQGIKNQRMLSYNLAFSFLLGGAIGNFIDRIKQGYVIDFIYIKFKRAPIFNLADVSIFVGALMLSYLEIVYGIF